MARYEIPWLSPGGAPSRPPAFWDFWYLALGAPPIPWRWCLAAGISGSLAHVASNQALSWGEASLLVPVSGAKPIALIALTPLLLARALPPGLAGACTMATAGIALSGIAPRRVHRHAPRPGLAFVLMGIATAMMAFSDVCGAAAVERAGHEHRLAVVALWLGFSGIPPLLTLPWARASLPRPNQVRAVGLGVLYTVFVSSIALAFALRRIPDARWPRSTSSSRSEASSRFSWCWASIAGSRPASSPSPDGSTQFAFRVRPYWQAR